MDDSWRQSYGQPNGQQQGISETWRSSARTEDSSRDSREERRRRSRSRSRDRDRDRGRRRSPRYRRSRSRSRDRYRRRSASRERANATKRLLLTQLPAEIQKDELTILFAKQGFIPTELQIYDKTYGGSTRSFGFVDFVDVITSKLWMDKNQGTLSLPDGRKVAVEYAKQNSNVFECPDWICSSCTLNNYDKRDSCFRCGMTLVQSRDLESRGYADFCDLTVARSDTLLLRDLPDGVNEAELMLVLRRCTADMLRIVKVKMHSSRNFAWVQMKNADEAATLLNRFTRDSFAVNGSLVVTSFSRRSLSVIDMPPSVQERPDLPSAVPSSLVGVGLPSNPLQSLPNMGMLPPGMSSALGATPNYSQPPPSVGGLSQSVALQQQLLQQQQQAQFGLSMPNINQPPPGFSMSSAPNYSMPPPSASSIALPGMGMTTAVVGSNASVPSQMNALYQQPPPQQSYLNPYAAVQQTTQPATPAAPNNTANAQRGVIGHINTPIGILAQYDTPNPQTFMPEPTSGYMHDPLTNFYYDPKTTYYFNAAAGKWHYYDAYYKTFIPVEDREKVQQAIIQEQLGNKPKAEEVVVQPAQAPKSAADIAKEMAKWAKKQEKQKVQMSLKPLVKPLETKAAFGSGLVAGAGDTVTKSDSEITMKMLDKAKNPLAHVDSDSDNEEMPPNAAGRHSAASSGIAGRAAVKEKSPEPKVRSAAEHRAAMEASLIDRNGKTCLLCRRAFASVDVLDKHIDKSELHKKNLEEKRVEWGKAYVASLMAATEGKEGTVTSTVPSPTVPSSTPGTNPYLSTLASTEAASSYQYRDRAKERRNIHGIDAIAADPYASSRKQSDDADIRKESDLAALRPIDSTNIGNKLLQKMGWQEGSGVGKNLQGIVNPIAADRRVEGTGLGLVGSKLSAGVNASLKDKTKAALFARYDELR